MNTKNWKIYARYILLTCAIGGVSAFLTQRAIPEYDLLQKPMLTPPNWVFPVVWSILFLLMGVSAARVYLAAFPDHREPLALYWLQLAVNVVWSLLFFNLQARGFAFFWLLILWALILWMVLAFRNRDPLAGYLQIPYLLWVTFAGYLNYSIWSLNR